MSLLNQTSGTRGLPPAGAVPAAPRPCPQKGHSGQSSALSAQPRAWRGAGGLILPQPSHLPITSGSPWSSNPTSPLTARIQAFPWKRFCPQPFVASRLFKLLALWCKSASSALQLVQLGPSFGWRTWLPHGQKENWGSRALPVKFRAWSRLVLWNIREADC